MLVGGNCGGGTLTSTSYVVNGGNDRMLFVIAGENAGVTYNGTSLTPFPLTGLGLPTSITNTLNLFYLPLGTNAASITGDIVLTCPGVSSGSGFLPYALDNVDQTNPVVTVSGVDVETGTGAGTNTITVNSVATGDGIFDFLQLRKILDLTSATEGAGQTRLLTNLTGGAKINSSFKAITGSSISTSWTWAPDTTFRHFAIIAKGVNSTSTPIVPATTSALVPTFSQWGLFIFALLTLNLGLVFLYNRNLVISGNSVTSFYPNVPFDRHRYINYFLIGLGVFSIIFIIAILFFRYSLMTFDIPGTILTTGLIAYTIELTKQNNSKE